MEYILKDKEYDVIVLLQKNREEGLSFAQIVNTLDKSATAIYKSLDKLRKANHITLLEKDYAHYKITDENEEITIRKVQCPKCQTVVRVHKKNQARTTCPNLDCTFPSGKRKSFEILSRELLKKGIRKEICNVQ